MKLHKKAAPVKDAAFFYGFRRPLTACSNAYAYSISVGSLNAWPANVIPKGSPDGLKPKGTVIDGKPAAAPMLQPKSCGNTNASTPIFSRTFFIPRSAAKKR